MTINRRTGLREGFHEYYQLPLVHQKGVGRLRLDGQLSAVHTTPYRPGVTLDFYSRLNRSDELVVTLHGAIDLTKIPYPVFTRVRSLKDKAAAMMSFADPTLLLDPTHSMQIAWYLGGPGWDPLPAILQAVRKAQGKTGARHIAFLGGSGGGFAALRVSAMVRGSMAFVYDPQTVLASYNRDVVEEYFSTAWPGWSGRSLLDAFPERFDMARHYRAHVPENFVFYVQNRSDHAHVAKHLTPFAASFGIQELADEMRGSRHTFIIYDGMREGHGNIQPEEFDAFYAEAMASWRAYRERLL